MGIPTEFGERLRQLREARGWVQEDLAQILHLSASTVARYERGLRDPDTETIVKLAELFDVSLDYLFGLTDRPGYTGKRLYLKDYLPQFPPDVRNWIARQEVAPYVLVAKELAEAGLEPDSIRSIALTIRHEILRHRPPTQHETKPTDDDHVASGERTRNSDDADNTGASEARTRRERPAETEQREG